MDLDRPLGLLTPTVDADVLAVLAGARASFTGRQVHRVAERHSERGVRNALHRLSEQGIVLAERAGSSVLYSLNRSHLAAPYIESLAQLRPELLRRIVEEVRHWKIPADFVALFGSAARREMSLHSDIDLFVVRPDRVDVDDVVWQEQTTQLSDQVTAWTGNDTRIFELSGAEVVDGLERELMVLLDIRDHGVRLHGAPGYLQTSAARSAAARG